MKTYVTTLISVFFLWCCSCHEPILRNGVNKGLSVHTSRNSNFIANQNSKTYGNEDPKNDNDRHIKLQSFKVDIYQDNELVSSVFFRRGVIVRGIGYNTQTKTQESEVEYFYKKNGEYDHTEVKGEDRVKEVNLEADKYERDFLFQSGFLKDKAIEFPLAALLADEVSDLSLIFSVAANYSNFKTETQIDGNLKVIKFIGFNKGIRFKPSIITLFIPDNTVIKDYELVLKDNYPQKELYKTEEGELTKEYFYDDNKIVKLIYKFNSMGDQTSLEKRFDYHKL